MLEFEEDSQIPKILGRPFIVAVGASLMSKNEKMTFEVGEEKIEFILTKLMKNPSI